MEGSGANEEVCKVGRVPDGLEQPWINAGLCHISRSGTSSKEALRAEMGSWVRTCNSPHRSTLRTRIKSDVDNFGVDSFDRESFRCRCCIIQVLEAVVG